VAAENYNIIIGSAYPAMLRLLWLADCRLMQLVARQSASYVGWSTGYADGKTGVTKHRSSAALVIQTFCGHADRDPNECGTLVMDAGR